MIYLVLPESVDTAEDLMALERNLIAVNGEAAANEVARSRAKRLGTPHTVRKLSTVSYFKGRP